MSDVSLLGSYGGADGAPIVESGSNANGEWIKYADGTMICTHKLSTTYTASTAGGALYYSATFAWSFPQTFISAPVLHGSSVYVTGGGNWIVSAGLNRGTSASEDWRLYSFNNIGTGYPSFIAIGRWK